MSTPMKESGDRIILAACWLAEFVCFGSGETPFKNKMIKIIT